MRPIRILTIALALGLTQPSGSAIAQESEGLAGAYLAATQAVLQGNHAEAAERFLQVLAADPDNVSARGDAVLALAASGEWERAAEIATGIPAGDPAHELARLVNHVIVIRSGDLAEASQASANGMGAGPLADPLLQSWFYLGEGNVARALANFENIIEANSPIAGLVPYQMALLHAAVGDFESANAVFSGEVYGPLQLSTRGVRAHAQVLVQLDRSEDALELINRALARIADPSLLALRDEIIADPTRPYDFLLTPAEGMAEVFFTLSRALGVDSGRTVPLIYARAAYFIDPEHVMAILLTADLLANDSQFEAAVEAYAQVPTDHAQFTAAEQGRADALFRLGREEAAIEVLTALARDFPDLATVHAALGDSYRQLERYEEAIPSYDAALALVDQSQQRYWFLFYARAISLDSIGDWDAAEADFRSALELDPDQPNVLNYLGYSLVEQRRNLDEALEMIERAVEARPDSGYIVDSLAWVLYRLGRFEEAVAPMERAVELLPNDWILNDHLGDVYWMVGRYREAEFQWSRALSFEPDDEAEADRIRLKLELGLDAVLAGEEAQDAAE